MRNIGINVKKPQQIVEGDRKDPFTSPISLRGQQLVGTVVSVKMQRTATIVMERQVHIKKYNRYIRKRSKVLVHNPDSIDAREGDVVRAVATRPLSKAKHHIIVEVLKRAGEQSSSEVGNVSIDAHHYKEAQESQHAHKKRKEQSEKSQEE